MAAPTWKGAVEFLGFPIHVALYQRVRSRSADSFKMLGSDDKPVRSILVEAGEYEKLEKDPHAAVLTIGRNDTGRGVQVSPGEFHRLSEDAREAIASAERSTMVEPLGVVPRDTIPFDLADKSLFVVPDKKVAGAETSVDQLYSYLSGSNRAYVTEVTFRSGSRDSILVLYADNKQGSKPGLYAVTIPFGEELNDEPAGFARAFNKKAVDKLAEVAAGYETVTFDFDEHQSKYAQRRETAIEAALKGKKVKAAAPAPELGGGKDLLAAISEGVGAAPKAKKASRARGGTKKPAAKRTTSRKKKVGA